MPRRFGCFRVSAANPRRPTTFLTIGGWPALQRRVVQARPQPGNEIDDDEVEQERGGPAQQKQMLTPANMLLLTTAVAAGDLLVRADGSALPGRARRGRGDRHGHRREPDVPRDWQPGSGQSRTGSTAPLTGPAAARRPARRRDRGPCPGARPALAAVRRPGSLRSGAAASPLRLVPAGAAVAVSGGSESEIAVSTNGQNIIIAQGFNYARSTNGGLSFTAGVGFAGTNGGDGRSRSAAAGRSTPPPSARLQREFSRLPITARRFPFVPTPTRVRQLQAPTRAASPLARPRTRRFPIRNTSRPTA